MAYGHHGSCPYPAHPCQCPPGYWDQRLKVEKAPTTEQGCYGLGYDHPSRSSREWEFSHLVDLMAFYCGQNDYQNQAPPNPAYDRNQYDPATYERRSNDVGMAVLALAFSEEGLVDQLCALRWKRRMGFLIDWKDVSADTKAGYRAEIRQILLDLKTILKTDK